MKKQTAILILREHKEKLITIPEGHNTHSWNDSWIIYLRSVIKEFLGEDSDEYKSISVTSMWVEMRVFVANINRPFLNDFIDNSIKRIQIAGLYKKPKINFIRKLSDTFLICILTVIIPSMLVESYNIGRYIERNKKSPITITTLPNTNPISHVK